MQITLELEQVEALNHYLNTKSDLSSLLLATNEELYTALISAQSPAPASVIASVKKRLLKTK